MSLEPSNRILESCEVTSQPSCLVSPAVSPALFVQTGRHLAGAVQWQRGVGFRGGPDPRNFKGLRIFTPLLPSPSQSQPE